MEASLADLLRLGDLEGVTEAAFPTDGWSGATFTSMRDRFGNRFVLKRTSLAIDWIARATRDDRLREGWFAAMGPRALDPIAGTGVAYLGAAIDGDGVAMLMPDLSAELISWDRPGQDSVVDQETVAAVVRAVARIHAARWPELLEAHAQEAGEPTPPWCPLPERLTLLTRRSATGYAAEANPVGDRFLAGWNAFDRHASASARDLVARLDDDPTPLIRALAPLPSRGLHGDLKLANVAITETAIEFIDWQLVMCAPVAVELGWLLVSNSASMSITPEAVLDLYRDAFEWNQVYGTWAYTPDDLETVVGDWDAQVDLTWIVGLLLRGWRKGLDAEAGVTLASGIRATDDLAWWCERAVAAAERRL